jgi:hypothetical protein
VRNRKPFSKLWSALAGFFTLPFFLIVSSFANAQQGKVDEKLINTVCEVGKNESTHILFKLLIKSVNMPSVPLEVYKEVFNEAITEDLNRLRTQLAGRKNASQEINIFIASSEINYKYALCEKYKRPSALPITIATENYFLCRRALVESNDTRPPPCF